MTDDAFHLTALDARRYDFGNALRGYDRARVDQFRDQVAEELERLSRANQELEVKARNFHEQLRAFRERDKALNDALISAQQLRGEIREQAQREAQLIIREAQGDAERSLEALRGEIRRAEDELQQLWRNRRSFVQQLRQLTERQLHDLESAETVSPPIGMSVAEPARESVRELSREPVKPAAPEIQIFRDEPRIAPPREAATPAPRVADSVPQRAPQSETAATQRVPQPEQAQRPQQPWARPAQNEQSAPSAAIPSPIVQPIMQPVPHPMPSAPAQPVPTQPAPQPIINTGVPPIAPSPMAVPPNPPRQALPTPSWLDVVEGE